MTLEELLSQARGRLRRLDAGEALRAMQQGATLVDIRSDRQREKDGAVPGAMKIARNVLEWRCAPTSAWRDPKLSDPGGTLILMCDEGYQSSLAAATLQELGLHHATDVIGGFQAWRGAGLPLRSEAGESRPG
jgi:rhodanese-related sulfurtransferase